MAMPLAMRCSSSWQKRVRLLLPRDARLARLGGDEFAFVMAYPVGHTDRVDDLVIRLFEKRGSTFRAAGADESS